jgi:LysM repeat protein
MSRRDTIIVAVLVNAGLLIVLFASALKSSSPGEEYAAAPTASVQEVPEFTYKKDPPAVMGDEVDQALSQFSQSVAAAPASEPASVPVAAAAPADPAVPNFADELKAIAVEATVAATEAPKPMVRTLTDTIAPKATAGAEFTEVRVKKGDVLEKIARHNHSTVADIMKANKLTNTNLRIGQVLKIPNKTIRKAEASTISHAVAAPASEGRFYTVKKGDSPWTIAVKNHLKVEDLLKLNNLTEEQARRLKPGDQLRIQ